MLYCVSDLHGCFNEFLFLLQKINFSNNDTMYILGDSIDRGEQPIELLKYIYEHDNIKSSLGNHELFLINYFHNKIDKDVWNNNGGGVTFAHFEYLRKTDPVLFKNLSEDIQKWPHYFVIGDMILSHAGYNGRKLDRPTNLDSLTLMTSDDFLWSRNEFIFYPGIDNYLTIFGHTPTRIIRANMFDSDEYSDDIWVDDKYKDKIGIDGAIFADGQINCLNLDTLDVIVVTSDEYWDTV